MFPADQINPRRVSVLVQVRARSLCDFLRLTTDSPNINWRIVMNGRKFGPVQSGKVPLVRQGPGEKPKEEERRQAGTPATLEGNIDNATCESNDTSNEPRVQGYATKWLVSHFGISANVAAIIANELGMEGA